MSIVVFLGLAERGARVCFFCGDDTTVGVLVGLVTYLPYVFVYCV